MPDGYPDGYLLQREGWQVNVKRVCRLYREMDLQLRSKSPKRRVKAKLREDRSPAAEPNQVWAMDFVHDELFDGKKIRSRPGKPTDNAFIESLNGKFRAACLNANWFLSLDEARTKCKAWRRDYNEV